MLTPDIGTVLTIDLPGERVRAPVVAVHDEDHVIVELDGAPMAKSHQYKMGDKVLVKRGDALLGQSWESVDERLLALQAAEDRKSKKGSRARVRN